MEPYLGQSEPEPQPSEPPETPVAAPVNPAPQQEPAVGDTQPYTDQPQISPVLQWQASEYISREKNTAWFVGLAVIAAALSAIAIFLIKDFTFALLVVVMAVALVVIARRPAKEMLYQLSDTQLRVGDKTFPLHSFRAFGVVQDGAIYYVSLVPIKRFRPSVNVYFPQELGEQIVDILGSVLPMEDMKPDMIDKITEKLNF